jgi:hypothetical protein
MKFSYIIYNLTVLVSFTALSVNFDKWWIMLFSLLFLALPGSRITGRYRICDFCKKTSESAPTREEAIKRAKQNGWIHIEKGDLDFCPECAKKIRGAVNENDV